MRKICIQSGHWNMKTGATGAPREQERTIAIGKRLVDLLRANGANVYHTDAFADSNKDVTEKDWDLFLALHCDANYGGDEGGGFVDWIDLTIDSSLESNKESERIAKAIEDVYFKESGIRNMPNRRNPNTKFYYMWNVLSADTHCVIIEMGESVDPHDNVILNDTERQAQILLKSIQNAFPDLKPVQPNPPTTPTQPTTPTIDYKAKYEQSLKDMEVLKEQCKKDVEAARGESAEAINALTVENGQLKQYDIRNWTYGQLIAHLNDKKIG